MYSKLMKKNKLFQVDAPVDTEDESKARWLVGAQKYAKFFKDDEQFELFWMLPLDDSQRDQLLRVLSEEKQLADQLADCEGSDTTDSCHRSRCVACVSKFRPAVSSPYH